MKKSWVVLSFYALAVAVVSALFVWLLLISYIMYSLPSVIETAMLASLAVIAVSFCTAVVLAWRFGSNWMYRAALVLMLFAGIAPAAIDRVRATVEEASTKVERQAFEAKFLSQLDTVKDDVASRIAARKPFGPREAHEFVEFVQGSNLNYRSLPDYSSAAFALLRRALAAKILDPNVRVKGPRMVDTEEEPLFVGYYKFYLQSGATMPVPHVRERDWTIFQMLIAGGANLDDPAAAVLRDVVKRETAPYDPNVRGYVRLK